MYMSILHRDSSYEHFSGSFEVDYNNYVEKKGRFILAYSLSINLLRLRALPHQDFQAVYWGGCNVQCIDIYCTSKIVT